MTEAMFIEGLVFLLIVVLLFFSITNKRVKELEKLIDSSMNETKRTEESIGNKILEAQRIFSRFSERSALIERQLNQEARNAEQLVTEMRSLIFKAGSLAECFVRLKNLCEENKQVPQKEEDPAVIEFPRVVQQQTQNKNEITLSRGTKNNHSFLGRNLSKLLKGVR